MPDAQHKTQHPHDRQMSSVIVKLLAQESGPAAHLATKWHSGLCFTRGAQQFG